ncbi:unnamed protein product [Arabidopsis arenosa]|uniref:Uncharacterized protein n=1 Tax=Arabidopsis arenosa TaxID=38785 RepID=A0A8S1ZLX0_ARAAE|nr:unnamed protein product [Arabidopsis arenosa]
MCKSHFVDYDLRGFPLERIYKHLDETKEIQSILEPEADEQHLVANIVENADYVDRRVTWNAALRDNQVVCWEDLYDRDVSNREIEMTTKENDKEAQVGRRGQVQKAVPRKKDDRYMNRLKRQLYRRIDQRVAEVGKSLLNPSQSNIEKREEEREQGLGTVGGTDHFAREVLMNVTPMHPSASRSPTIPVIDAGKQKGTREILKCYLINPNGSKDVVAIGVRDPSRLVIHSVPVKPHEVVVTVSEVKIDIPVWEPKDDVEMLSNAVGAYIVWPKDSVLPYEDEDEEDKAEDKDNLYQSDQRNRVVNEENPGTRKRKREKENQSLQPSYSPAFQSLGTVGGTDHFAREVLTNVTPMHPSASRSPTIPVIDAGKQKGTREILKCYLINPNGSKDVVAIGVRDPSRLVIHSVPVKPHEVVVTVSEVKIDIPVWEPKDDVEMLSNAVGSYIVWPKDSVLPYEDEDEEDKAEDKDNLYQSDQRNRVVNEENPGTRKRKREKENQSLQPSYSPAFQSLDEPEQTGANQEDDGQLQLHQKPLKVYVRQERVTYFFERLVGNEQVALRTPNQLGNGRKKPYITQGGRKVYSPDRFTFATYE